MTLKGVELGRRTNAGFGRLAFVRSKCSSERDGGQAGAPTPTYAVGVESILVDIAPGQKRTANLDRLNVTNDPI